MIILYILVSIVAFKIIRNFIKYRLCQNYLKKYVAWLEKKPESTPISEYQIQIINLFKEAGVKDVFVAFAEPVGYGYVSTGNTSVFDNINNNRQVIVRNIMIMFAQAKGVYRSRLWEAINPIFWIEFIIYLPSNILKYLGVSENNVSAKILNILWWIMSLIGTSVATVYNPSISTFIKNFINTTLP